MAELKKHSIAKKQHRERSQPLERKKWSLLEKKKDYKLRAADYHKKQSYLKYLRKKATDRNPDEFHHAMNNQKTDNRGVLVKSRGNEDLSNDAVKLLKTQDSGYIRTMNNIEKKNIERLEASLFLGNKGKHTVFEDTPEDAKNFKPSEYFDTDPSMVYRAENRLNKSQMKNLPNVSAEQEEEINKERVKKLKELDQRMARQSQLDKVQQGMNQQRELMKKGDKKKMVDKYGNKTFKWKNVRKK